MSSLTIKLDERSCRKNRIYIGRTVRELCRVLNLPVPRPADAYRSEVIEPLCSTIEVDLHPIPGWVRGQDVFNTLIGHRLMLGRGQCQSVAATYGNLRLDWLVKRELHRLNRWTDHGWSIYPRFEPFTRLDNYRRYAPLSDVASVDLAPAAATDFLVKLAVQLPGQGSYQRIYELAISSGGLVNTASPS